jgi:hypothetical protein
MFRHGGAMQLSAANLLIASQQIARGVQQPSREVQAQFAAALARENSAAGAAAFEPIEFRQNLPEPPSTPATAPRATVFGQPGPLGANLDIRV